MQGSRALSLSLYLCYLCYPVGDISLSLLSLLSGGGILLLSLYLCYLYLSISANRLFALDPDADLKGRSHVKELEEEVLHGIPSETMLAIQSSLN